MRAARTSHFRGDWDPDYIVEAQEREAAKRKAAADARRQRTWNLTARQFQLYEILSSARGRGVPEADVIFVIWDVRLDDLSDAKQQRYRARLRRLESDLRKKMVLAKTNRVLMRPKPGELVLTQGHFTPKPPEPKVKVPKRGLRLFNPGQVLLRLRLHHKPTINRCASLIFELLKRGPRPAAEIQEYLAEWFLPWTIQEASVRLKIQKPRDGFGPGSQVIWALLPGPK